MDGRFRLSPALSRSTLLVSFLTSAALLSAQTPIWEVESVPGVVHEVSLAGDWDGDGLLDLAFGGNGTPPETWRIDIVRGADAASLAVLSGNSPGQWVGGRMICPGDLDGDGLEDLLATGFSGTSGIYDWFVRAVSSATGRTLFEAPGFHSNDCFGSSLAALDDFNGDGVSELLVGAGDYSAANLLLSGAIAVLDGATGQSLYHRFGNIHFGGFGGEVAALGDLDGDGLRDFIVSGGFSGGSYAEVHIFSAASGTVLRAHTGIHGVALTDWGDQNGDLVSDYLIGAPFDDTLGLEQGAVYGFSGADGSLLLSLYPHPVPPVGERFGRHLASGADLDGDGLFDFAVGFPNWKNGSGSGGIEVFDASGLWLYGQYGHRVGEHLGSLEGHPVLTPDFNGDGRPELLSHRQIPGPGGPGGSRMVLISGWDDHPVLRIPRHRAGTVCSLEISNAVPGAVIHVGYSAGPGPVSTALGLVHLSPPIQLLPPIWVGANGAGVRQARIPHALRGIDAYLHALERAPSGGLRLSQPLWIVVQ